MQQNGTNGGSETTDATRAQKDHQQLWASPRAIVLGWCLWLLGVWGVSLWIDSAVPATRWMLFSTLLGLMVLWPTVRLSLDTTRRGHTTSQVIVEWLALITIFQAVVWPLAITARWGFAQTLWLDLAVLSWSLVAALLVAMGSWSRRGLHRSVAAVLCIGLLLGEPLAVGLLSQGSEPSGGTVFRVSPIQTVWALTEMPADFATGPWRTNVVCAAAAGAIGWFLFGLFGPPKAR